MSSLPHSRACTFKAHSHGTACHTNCPTCGGSFFPNDFKETQMSDQPFNKPQFPKPTDVGFPPGEDPVKVAKEKFNEVKNDPNVQQGVEKGRSFYQENKPLVIGVVAIVGLRVYRKKISKQTAKQVLKTLEKAGKTAEVAKQANNLPTMHDILNDLRKTPGMAYIPHGGGMVHLLKGKDAIVTVFGDFDNMSNDQIWNTVANILNLNVRV